MDVKWFTKSKISESVKEYMMNKVYYKIRKQRSYKNVFATVYLCLRKIS